MIVVNNYGGGIFNQLTSFEISYGLSKFLGDKVVIHDLNKKIVGRDELDQNLLPSFINNNKNIRLIDVIDFESHENLIIKLEAIPELLSQALSYDKSYTMHYFNIDQNNNDNEADFSCGRKLIDPNKDYIMRGANLIYYSSFFFNPNKEFDNVMSSIKFKKEYYDFANEIISLIGKFNGCHIRRRDHIGVVDINEKRFKSGIDRFNNNLPILISTDEYHNPMFKNNKVFLLEDIIENNLKKEFMQLHDSSDLAFAIISNLVMRHSEDFIGTGTSTFTGHIQRNLYKNKNIDFKFFNEDDLPEIKIGKTKYSWQQANGPIEYLAVVREWPECRLGY